MAKSSKKRVRSSKLIQGKVSITRDPRVYAEQLPPLLPPYKRVVGLDYGTDCGVAVADFIPGRPIIEIPIIMGQWDLKVGRYDSGPLRHIRLKGFLRAVEPSLIGFEDVRFTPPADSFRAKSIHLIAARITPPAEFLGGLKVTVSTWAEEHKIPCQGLAIAEIKQFATSKGNASKEMMIEAANKRFGLTLDPKLSDETGIHNMVDAAFVCLMMLTAYAEGLA